jgi:hypothetical protein
VKEHLEDFSIFTLKLSCPASLLIALRHAAIFITIIYYWKVKLYRNGWSFLQRNLLPEHQASSPKEVTDQ